MRDSFVHYHVPPGYICSKTACRSQRKGLLLRLWARPLVSKCVIIFAFGAVCLTEWPSDLHHLLIVPWWPWRHWRPHSCRVFQQLPSVWTTVLTWHWWYLHTEWITSCQLRSTENRWQLVTRRHLWVRLHARNNQKTGSNQVMAVIWSDAFICTYNVIFKKSLFTWCCCDHCD